MNAKKSASLQLFLNGQDQIAMVLIKQSLLQRLLQFIEPGQIQSLEGDADLPAPTAGQLDSEARSWIRDMEDCDGY